METTRDIRVLVINNREVYERLVKILSVYMTKQYLLKFEQIGGTDGWIVYFIKNPKDNEIIRKIVREREEFEKHIVFYLIVNEDGSVILKSRLANGKEREIINEQKVFTGRPFKFIDMLLIEAHNLKNVRNTR